MNRIALILLATAANAPAWAAIAYTRFAHPGGDYVLEFPANWKRAPGLQSVSLRPPGKDGSLIRVTLDRHPFGKESAATAEDFAAKLIDGAKGGKTLESRRTVAVSGRSAERFALAEKGELRGEFGQTLPGPMREVTLIIPFDKSTYYVLSLKGVGEAFEKALPEFDHIVGKLRLGPEKKPAGPNGTAH